jgi:hypothetical protein
MNFPVLGLLKTLYGRSAPVERYCILSGTYCPLTRVEDGCPVKLSLLVPDPTYRVGTVRTVNRAPPMTQLFD